MTAQSSSPLDLRTINPESNQRKHDDWLNNLPKESLKKIGLTKYDIKQQLPAAKSDCFTQLIKAILREHIYPTSIQLLANFTIPLWKQKRLLVIQDLHPTSLGQFRNTGQVILAADHCYNKKIINDPNELLKTLVSELEKNDPKGVEYFHKELSDSIRNQALALAYRKQWRQRLRAEMLKTGDKNFWHWNAQRVSTADLSIFWEQWGCVGHPFHPNKKSKIGLQPKDVLALSPDFEAEVNIRLAAIKNNLVHTESSQNLSATQWFSNNFPDWYQAWCDELQQRGLNCDNYTPIPVHPWQADNILPNLFSELIGNKNLLLLNNIELKTKPSMSFRTMIPQINSDQPHIKLPTAIQMTSAMRTVSPRSCELGPRISQLIDDILRKENSFNHSFYALSEQLGIHLISNDEQQDQKAKHLSCILRTNPHQVAKENEIVVPVATLLADSIDEQTPLLIEILRHQSNDPLSAAKSFLQDYSQKLLQATLCLYLKYGISLEAHQQNSLAVFNQDGEFCSFLVRDFGGIRIHLSTLEASGHQFKMHRDRLTVSDDIAVVRNKVIHTVFICHLGELVMALASYFDKSDQEFWLIIRDQAEQIFNQLKHLLTEQQQQDEWNAFFTDNWSIKALTRMRLEADADYIHFDVDNPLKQESFGA
jgi:siderophore synthetase component